MIVPVVLCTPAPWPVSVPVHGWPPDAALAHAVELLSWFDTALLCVAPQPQADTLCQLLGARQLSAHLLLTPAACGSVTGLALATTHLEQLGLDPLMLVAPARIPVAQAASLAYTVRQARPAAQAGAIVAVGVEADQAGPFAPGTRLHTQGHRYDGCYRVSELDTGDFKTRASGRAGPVLHSTGLYLARASAWRHALAVHAPATWQGACEAMAHACPAPLETPGLSGFLPDTDRLALRPTPSLEHGLLQHLSDLAAITLHQPPGQIQPLNARTR